MSFEGLVGNTNYESDEFLSSTAYLFSQHNENLANGLYDNAVSIGTPPAAETKEIPINIQNIGVFNGSSSIALTDSIQAGTHPDVYQFSIDHPNDFTITLNGLSADADLYLFDGNGLEVAVSNNSALEAETLSGTLDAGTYSLGIVSYDGIDTGYDLAIQTGEFASGTAITSPAPVVPNDPGATIDMALDFGAFDGDGWLAYEESVSGSDPVDLYQFSIGQSNNFNFVVEGMMADVDLHLVDQNGAIIAASENLNTDVEILAGSLPAGTYYLGVASYDGLDTSYNLHVIGGESALSTAEIDAVAPGLATDFALV